MARRTKEDALATRDLILDTAERVFLQRGVSRTSLHEIAQAAGVTRGAIYWHFQNKADLFDAMMQRVTLPLETGFSCEDVEAFADPLGQLRAGVARSLQRIAQDPQLRRVFEIAMLKTEYVNELQEVRDRHIRYREKCQQDMQRMFDAARTMGQVRADVSPADAACGALSLIDGLLYGWVLHSDAFDLQKMGQGALDAYLLGLTLPAPRTS